jgi:hypothetical protein
MPTTGNGWRPVQLTMNAAGEILHLLFEMGIQSPQAPEFIKRPDPNKGAR